MQSREAQKMDYAAICSLVNDELGYPDVSEEELTHRIDMMNQDKSYCVFIALIDEKIVGFIGAVQSIAFEHGKYMRITALAVAKEYQNRGIGGSLLKHVEDFTASMGITVITLNSGLARLDAHKFYEHNGYAAKSYGFWKE